jgi:hypothetical protein
MSSDLSRGDKYVIWAPRGNMETVAICWGYLGQMRIPGLYINHTLYCRWLCEQCVRINYLTKMLGSRTL